ncbi:MAG: T9SS type A sorting domain-containing protein [Saprospiraceae bacterium]|nr:T9SS type A sorting domain-containing protein [Saprospiraceae bacterium]
MKFTLALFLMIITVSGLHAQYDHKDILPNIEGETLLQELNTQFRPTQVQSYSDARYFMFTEVYNQGDTVETIYAGLKRFLDPRENDPIQYFLTGEQNIQIDTEHSYPRSKGADRNTNAGSDLHHLFPSRKLINSSRGNLPFGEVIDSETETWYLSSQMQSGIPGSNINAYSELGPDRFEPRENQKGNVARAMFYFYSMYRNQADAADPQFFHVMKDNLCDWHYEDPVDSLEWERSKMIGTFQGHEANPFVLDCSLAARLYCDEISDPCAFLTSLESIKIEEVNIVPNPVNEIVKINLSGIKGKGQLKVIIFDLIGKNVMELKTGREEIIIDASSFPAGLYQLVVMDQTTMIGKSKLIKH